MATQVPQQRLAVYNTLAAVREVLAAFCGYSMGISLSAVVETTAQALGKEINERSEPMGVQTTYDTVQVGAFIEAGDLQGGVDPAVNRELVFTLATDSTFFGRSGGKKNSTCINMAEAVAGSLAQKKKVFNMESTSLMAINGGDVGKWNSAAQAVSRLSGWNRNGQVLIWVDNGNSWHSISNDAKRRSRALGYSDLAASMCKN